MRSRLFLCAILLSAAALRAEPPSFNFGVNVSHWLSQLGPHMVYGDPHWFAEEDVAWIAENGYDHLRLPVDGRLLLDAGGNLQTLHLKPVDQALVWASEHGLGIVLDMHFLDGADFTRAGFDNRLFENPHLRARAVALWGALARRYHRAGDLLRFELINEPVAANPVDLATLQRAMLEEIRSVSRDRVIYVTSNEWGRPASREQMYVPRDPRVILAFHFYEPFIFTHQQTPWSEIGRYYMRPVPFPGTLLDLRTHFPEGHWVIDAYSGVQLNEAYVEKQLRDLAGWAHGQGKQVYLSEFGVVRHAQEESARAWIRAVRRACRDYAISWAVWDYKGTFGIRHQNGEPTFLHEAIIEAISGQDS